MKLTPNYGTLGTTSASLLPAITGTNRKVIAQIQVYNPGTIARTVHMHLGYNANAFQFPLLRSLVLDAKKRVMVLLTREFHPLIAGDVIHGHQDVGTDIMWLIHTGEYTT